MRRYSSFFKEKNEKGRLSAMLLLIMGVMIFISVLWIVHEMMRESKNGPNQELRTATILFIICDFLLLTALIFFFIWNVRMAAKFEICKMEAELDRQKIANQAKSDFLSGMSHELRTPMNAIVGLTTLTQRSVGDEEKTRKYLHQLEISTSYMLSLINDILDMSRIEKGKMTIYEIPFDFYEVTEAIEAMIYQISSQKGQFFQMDVKIEHSQIVGDKIRLQQVIVNLLNNAVKYTAEGGRIQLKIEERKYEKDRVWIYVEVSDTGIGIWPEDQEQIFEPFEEAKGKVRNGVFSPGGAGLGLSICRDLLHRMGSEIYVESVPQQGSRFSFEVVFPCAEEKETADENLSENVWNLEGRRFLIAEDNEMNRDMLMDLLMDEGVQCDAAEDGETALNMFETSCPGTYDAILMDIQMPRMDGLEAARRIRAADHPDGAGIPLIAMSAYAFTEDVDKSRKAGMNEYITKPINIVELCKLLNHLIDVYRKTA